MYSASEARLRRQEFDEIMAKFKLLFCVYGIVTCLGFIILLTGIAQLNDMLVYWSASGFTCIIIGLFMTMKYIYG